MIFITGDCHGDYRRFSAEVFPEQKKMTKEDYVIICGDFGYWDRSKEQKYWRKWLEEKPFTTLFVDGNHENYDMLKELPVKEWKGGRIQQISPSVFRLMRGQVYEIAGKRWFTFGGASSHDIEGGILEPDDPKRRQKQKMLERRGISYRVRHVSWWDEELPSEAECREGRENLVRVGNSVDYIITHCAPTSVQEMLCEGNEALYRADLLTDYLEEIRRDIAFRQWFFGHYHQNGNPSPKFCALYEQILQLC